VHVLENRPEPRGAKHRGQGSDRGHEGVPRLQEERELAAENDEIVPRDCGAAEGELRTPPALRARGLPADRGSRRSGGRSGPGMSCYVDRQRLRSS
jgi:hypothetical protein